MNINDIEIVKECPWCKHAKSTKWCNDKEPYLTVECDNCGIVYVKNRLNEKGRIEYYKNYNSRKHQEEVKRNLRDKMYQLEFKFLNDFIKKGNILDVGCGGGFFLDSFNNEQYTKCGVEYGEDGFNVANKKYPHNIFKGEFPLLDNIPKGTFDLIIFRGVLEHVINPKDYLKKAYDSLKDGGFLFISATPNLNSLCADLFRENFNQHIPAEHIILFGDNHFKTHLNKIGFKLISERIFYVETPYANILEDAKKITDALELKANENVISFKSPAWYGNMMTLLFQRGC